MLIAKFEFQCMKQNLEKCCVDNGMFGDITFELDDGRMRAHRAMLVARCEVMRAMLNGDFREAHAHTVTAQSIPGSFLLKISLFPDLPARSHWIHIPQTPLLFIHRRDPSSIGRQVLEPAGTCQPAVSAKIAEFDWVQGDREFNKAGANWHKWSRRALSQTSGTSEGKSWHFFKLKPILRSILNFSFTTPTS